MSECEMKKGSFWDGKLRCVPYRELCVSEPWEGRHPSINGCRTGATWLENTKMVPDKTAKASRPDYDKWLQSGDTEELSAAR